MAGRLVEFLEVAVIWAIISSIIIGLILGVVARLILPGKQNIPIWLTIVVGIVAAFIGNWLAGLLGVRVTDGFDWIRHLIQVVLAVIGIGVVAGVYGKKGVRS
ncbi:MAG TPA: GlsB/YeaQ/YmgE family stress response membrane protein [Pseudonocardia sp.]|uniref:GlsB/YeaQ/YmgE family stress response membrane protein n=1 Tax=Pseudonocardia sp. TaxID=60912 RepID=UPI002C5BEE0A|nr:GlsB/YeaQ/YmgE family stress response membrane protein [Pseudonocardia sp.]HTF50402.1 GlsB/YeaQ/YmgE family stress response membrane protein [Pseudonocardia sp.]